jgi:RNA polymerase sigma factor for flagellar operon FliA
MWIGKTGREERAQLWRGYRQAQGADQREQLIQAYEGYARMIAARCYSQRMRDSVGFDDYLQFARLGLIEALDRFEPERGILFETFAAKRIKGSIVDGIATTSEVQQQLAERRQRLRERTASLDDAEQDVSSQDAEQLFAQLADIAIGLAIGYALEADSGTESGEPAFGDTTYASVELKQLRDLILAAVRDLPDRERHVITSHYLQQRAFAEVAEELGVTRGRVSQLHRDGIERLRRAMKRRTGIDLSY